MMSKQYQTNVYVIDENFRNLSISVDTTNVIIEPSTDEKTTVVCFEKKKTKHKVIVNNDTLEITGLKRKWYNCVRFKQPKLTVSIPKNKLENVLINCKTGNVDVRKINCVSDLDVNVFTGKTVIRNIYCNNFNSMGCTGKVSLENLIVSNELTVKRCTGAVVFKDCDAAMVFVKTKTGSIKGHFLTEKGFVAKTTTGKIKVPNNQNGGRCELKTTTGSIKFL